MASLWALLALQETGEPRPGRPFTPGKYESLTGGPIGFSIAWLRHQSRGSGGRPETEAAFLQALGWLARHQNLDGSWTAQDEESRVAVVGTATLAFLLADFTPYPPEFSRPYRPWRSGSMVPDATGAWNRDLPVRPDLFYQTVRRALRWLLERQQPDGFIGTRGYPGSLLGHLIAGMALSEAYGCSTLLTLREPAERAIGALFRERGPDGRWHGETESQDDKVHGWLAVALHSAILSDLPFDRAGYEGLRAWLREPERPGEGTERAAARLIVWRHLRAVQRPKAEAEKIPTGSSEFLKNLPSAEGENPDYHGWHWVTTSLFWFDGPEGPRWKRWSPALQEAMVKLQVTGPSRDQGSWVPGGPGGIPGRRTELTALNALTLATYYRAFNTIYVIR